MPFCVQRPQTVDTSPASWVLLRDSVDNPSRVFGHVCRFLLAGIIILLSFRHFSAIVLFVDEALQVPSFDQPFYLFVQLLAVLRVVTIIMMEEAITITAPLISEFMIQASRFHDSVS